MIFEQRKYKIILGLVWVATLVILVLGVVFWHWKQRRKFVLPIGSNIVLVSGEKLAILAVRGGQGEFSSFVSLPANLYLDLPGGGRYRATSVWELAEFRDDVDEPGELLMGALSRALSVPVSAYVVLKGGGKDVVSVEGVIDQLLRPTLVTNLTWWDRYRLRLFLASQLKKQQIVLQRLPEGLVSELTDADGLKILMLVDQVSVDNWASREYVMDAVLTERLSAAVINNSKETGRARLVGRLLETAGIRVVKVDSAEIETDGCVYKMGNFKLKADTEASRIFLRVIMGCRQEQDLNVDLEQYRADIVVVTGKRKFLFLN